MNATRYPKLEAMIDRYNAGIVASRGLRWGSPDFCPARDEVRAAQRAVVNAMRAGGLASYDYDGYQYRRDGGNGILRYRLKAAGPIGGGAG